MYVLVLIPGDVYVYPYPYPSGYGTAHLVVSSIPPSQVLYTYSMCIIYIRVSVHPTDILPSHEIPRLGVCCGIW